MSSIKNLDKLMSKLTKIGKNSTLELENSMKKNIKLVQAEAKTLCPVDTGELRNSIVSDAYKRGNEVIGEVYTHSDHAAYVEFGTGQVGESTNTNTKVDVSYREDWVGMEAQPYMYPALHDKKGEVLLNIVNDLRRAIND